MASILLSIAVSAAMSFVARMFQPAQEGPRLTDLKLHGSSYGVMNPLLWGTMRVPGNVIDETDLVEHKHSSGGKGGGPQVNTYTYTVSAAIRLCDVEAEDVTKIWANGRLIYGPDIDNTVPVTFYLGTEDQLPDPTFEAVHGVGNVPAYRGVCYAVFTDWDLTEFGNTLPNLNFEVVTKRVPATLERVSTWTVPQTNSAHNTAISGLMNGDNIDVVQYLPYTSSFGGGAYQVDQYDINGNHLSQTEVVSPTFNVQGVANGHSWIASPNSYIAFQLTGGQGDDPTYAWWYGHGLATTAYVTGGGTSGYYSVGSLPYLHQGALYSVGGNGPPALSKWTADGGSVLIGAATAQFDFSTLGLNGLPGYDYSITANGKYLYVAGPDPSNTSFDALFKFDTDLNLIHTWHSPQVDPSPQQRPNELTSNHQFTVFGNYIIFVAAGFAYLYKMNGDFSFTFEDKIPATTGDAVNLGKGLILVRDGVLKINSGSGGVLLSEIVADISERAGLDSSEYDVTELTDIVAGYLVTQQGSARTMLQPLRDAYFVDAVERDDVVVFVKRGGKSVVTIPDDDLAAHLDGETLPPILTTTRTQEVDLPATFNVDFVNAAADYQTGTQRARRLVTNSQSEMKIELPVSLTDAQAKAIADTHLYEAWQERQRYSIQTSRKYAMYEPTDIITAGGQDICIRQKHEVRGGVIKFDGVSVLSSVYTAGGGAVATKGFRTSGTSSTAFTKALLLDLPLINDGDDPNGFYVAMAGGDGAWSGASLMKSADGGATYSSVVSTATPSVTGTTSDVLGVYLGGNTFDELNTVTVVTTGGELSSTTETAVLNGANVAVIGAEIIQFKNAVLTDTNTYVLSGLLRGRRGTEWAMSHLAGENFALLPTVGADVPSVDLMRERLYKPVTFGKTLASTTAVPFTNSGNRIKPYSPVHAGGGIDAAGNVTLQCTRRTRIGGNWVDFSDVPVSETTNRFIWQIWDSSYSQCARIIDSSYAMDVSRPTASYSVADITTDFGALQQTYFVTVAQVGAVGIGRQTQFTVPGSGGSNNAPLSPITPYNNPVVPPPTSGSCAPVGTVITTPLSWTTPITVYSGAFTTSDVWVLPFTTGSSVAGRGYFGAAEYGGSPITRSAYVALSPCGTALKSAGGTSINFSFCGSPNPDPASFLALQPNTTYYVMVETTANGPMVANLFPNR